jgi:hypothetical protein
MIATQHDKLTRCLAVDTNVQSFKDGTRDFQFLKPKLCTNFLFQPKLQ